MTEHPITPPRELMQQWMADSPKVPIDHGEYIATQAARWGADQELEACCEWLLHDLDAYELVGLRAVYLDHNLRAARRPKPPSLKEHALLALSHLEKGAEPQMDATEAAYTIRRALESLPDEP